MKKLLMTNSGNWSALVARLVLGATVFAHGAQKLFGWFGGYGFKGTMGFLTGQVGLSSFIALMVILIESVAAVMIIAGAFTRVAAIGIFGLFAVIMFKFHSVNGFFMNWAGNQKGEGIEYFIILLGVALTLVIAGGGKASIDAALITNKSNNSAV
jgi:putative oxidoreductase